MKRNQKKIDVLLIWKQVVFYVLAVVVASSCFAVIYRMSISNAIKSMILFLPAFLCYLFINTVVSTYFPDRKDTRWIKQIALLSEHLLVSILAVYASFGIVDGVEHINCNFLCGLTAAIMSGYCYPALFASEAVAILHWLLFPVSRKKSKQRRSHGEPFASILLMSMFNVVPVLLVYILFNWLPKLFK